RDAVSLSMGPERWRWSSVPSRRDTATHSDIAFNDPRFHIAFPDAKVHNAEVHWYSPFAVVKEHDLKPNLDQKNGGENNRQVLAISVPRVPLSVHTDPGGLPDDSLWVGLTYSLDPAGIDLSKSQFLEIWINDPNDVHDPANPFPRPRVRADSLRLH